ncbi:MAG: L-histidine N(alpha)-methyltransferase [Thermoleophilia bacterium]|nr:L-histidine N(alpha)-methyltransferase [Thermoleophilia bacterium]
MTIQDLSGQSNGSELAEDVLDGLTRPLKELPPKYFYDAAGALLFDRICDLPEYYPTRTEAAILRRDAAEIVARTGATELVELGSGYATKTRILLEEMDAAGNLRQYVPIDVTDEVVRGVAASLVDEYPALTVHGIIGDFERDLEHIPEAEGPRVVAFLGGTLGNFTPGARRRFLRDLGDLLRPQDHLLIGHDLVKDVAIIEAAYNDSAGITAAFNRNILKVVNQELDANFDPEAFEHVAFFDRRHEWIEMRLRATLEMDVSVRALNLDVHFDEGEELRTEISAKFTRERLTADLDAAGLVLDDLLTDSDDLYGLSLSHREALS